MGLFGLNNQEKIYWDRLKAGQRVDVVVSAGVERTYASKVKEDSGEELVIEIPRLGNLVLDVEAKTAVIISVYTEEGVFKFSSKIVRFEWDKSICVIDKPKNIGRVQRRQAFRLEKILPLNYAVLATYDPSMELDNLPTPLIAMAKNISEGGLLAVLNERYPGSEVYMKVQISLEGPGEIIVAIAKIMGQSAHPDVPGKFITRMQFVSIDESAKDVIRKFVLLHSRKEAEG